MVSIFLKIFGTFFRSTYLITSLMLVLSLKNFANTVNISLNSREDYGMLLNSKGKDNDFLIKQPYHDPKKKKTIKVVLDAGHGGHDSGASGKNCKEKDLTLKLALLIEQYFQKAHPEVEILQTRTTDVFIPLFRRIQYANEEKADLFISIHCNWIKNPKTRGTETFVLGLHRAEDNLEVAKRENASILLEQNYEANYEGYDPHSPEGHIMLSMYQNTYLDKSIAFADAVEKAFSQTHISKSRGVKQAGFAVLRRASMPAILLEAGFLSNDLDEAYIMSEDGQHGIAQAVLKAFDQQNIGKFNEEDSPMADKQTQVLEKEAVLQTIGQQNKSESMLESKLEKTSASSDIAKTKPVYKVQIAAFKNERADLDSAELQKVGRLELRKSKDMNKYLVGDYVSRTEAETARDRLKKMGYEKAFIVLVND